MIKKALVALLSSAILATTVVSGVVTTPTVAYAAETKVIKIKRNDCVNARELGDLIDTTVESEYDGLIKRIEGIDGYFLYVPEYNEVYDGDEDEIEIMVYKLPEMSKGSSIVIQTGSDGVIVEGYEYTDADYIKYTISYDGSSYSVTNMVTYEEDEKAKNEKMIEDMVVCKHQSAGNVTLSASEKKGTLIIKKADMKTAEKLDKMLQSEHGKKKGLILKIKASSRSKAKKLIGAVSSNVGHVNTYGVCLGDINYYSVVEKWEERYCDYGFFCEKKLGDYYVMKLTELDCKSYVWLCKAYKNAFKRVEKRKTGYSFPDNVHLCDCSDLTKLAMIYELVYYTYGAERGDSYCTGHNDKYYDLQLLATNKGCWHRDNSFRLIMWEVCLFTDLAKDTYVYNYPDAEFHAKDSSGKDFKLYADSSRCRYVTSGTRATSNDIKALKAILGDMH